MSTSDLLLLLRVARVLRGSDLLARLQIGRPTMSRATMMRLLKGLGNQIVMGGAARSSAYAVRRSVRGNSASLPVYQIDSQGNGVQVATLDPIYPNGCRFKVNAPFEWGVPEEWQSGLPYMLDDMRPQGFLGRHFAHAHADLLQVSPDPARWSEDDVLGVLSLLGSDVPGNLIVGEPAFRRYLQRMQEGYQPVPESQLAAAYPLLAKEALDHGVPVSSAAGEFPKFTTCRIKYGTPTQVLVKFSGNDQSAAVMRWSDLLVCEHLALESINALLSCRAAESLILQSGGRTFLEVQRFDRHGEFGRSALCSWAALEAALFGMAGATWIEGAKRALKEKMMSELTLQHITQLWHFGKLIANTDMHEGNLSFRPAFGKLELAPAYDMLPMLYAPLRGTEIPQRSFVPELPVPGEKDSWLMAAKAAQQFWQAAAGDTRISAEFRQICVDNQNQISTALQKMGS